MTGSGLIHKIPCLLLVLAIFSVSACTSARRGEPVAGPLKIDSEKVARGQKVFMVHCDKCHPGGEAGLGFAINNKPLPGPLIKTQIRTGVGAMPSFSKELLPDDQLDDLVEYIQTLRKHPD
ncbi:cytochrome c [Geobacter sp. DSM 9736]|uniref:c-type cytochrome n=1 Tax=Geobacter sp. DSM 9736 TaxID=1277350 RepID=UPI000B60AB3D|nr:cytochrome c [Geobacter sp. DSM 9736]SNB44674.1 Cytochrome C oxidase, cbb3-type, subunit III [Geobacter sp. DSM 9736]